MKNSDEYLYRRQEYTQSANSLFHFMQERKFLLTSLKKKALFPRYCEEQIDYLNLQDSEMVFPKIAVLEKCFCDISLHNIGKEFDTELDLNSSKDLDEEIKEKVPTRGSHTDFYGKYGIAFSKRWGEEKGIQPVWYINEEGEVPQILQEVWRLMMNTEELPEILSDDILYRLTYIKPLKGRMARKTFISIEDVKKEQYVTYVKNFHDEREWRYVPNKESLKLAELDCVLANMNMMEASASSRSNTDSINANIEIGGKYRCLWLDYSYDDIKYLIVPNSTERLNLIKEIMELPDGNFNLNQEQPNKEDEIKIKKVLLASKILVLNEIERDV